MLISRIIRRAAGLPINDPASVLTASEIPENWHEELISMFAAILRPRVYVELGLYECALFNRIIPYAEKLYGVDSQPEAGTFMHNVPGKTEFFAGTTLDFAKKLERDPIAIDLLFIDANHAKESVLADFRAFFPFVAPHGLILLHDSHPKSKQYTEPGYCNNAFAAIEELGKDTQNYELMTIPRHPGLTICRKRKTQLAWQETR